MTYEIIVLILWIISMGLTEYAKTAILSENAHAAIRAYSTVVLALRQVKVKTSGDRTLFFDGKTGKFIKKEAAIASISVGHRIVQGLLSTVLGVIGGTMYFV